MRINTQFWVIHFILQLIFSQSDYTMICSRLGVGPWREQFNTVSKKFREAKQLRDQAKTIADYREALSVILVAESGLSAEQAADITGTSRRSIFRNRNNIRDQDVTSGKTWGDRRRCTMTIEQERTFLAQWEVRATEGGVLSVLPIHAALVEQLGDIPMSTTYRLLARHDWRKVQPDTKHPKSDPAQQDEFKKNLRCCGCRPA